MQSIGREGKVRDWWFFWTWKHLWVNRWQMRPRYFSGSSSFFLLFFFLLHPLSPPPTSFFFSCFFLSPIFLFWDRLASTSWQSPASGTAIIRLSHWTQHLCVRACVSVCVHVCLSVCGLRFPVLPTTIISETDYPGEELLPTSLLDELRKGKSPPSKISQLWNCQSRVKVQLLLGLWEVWVTAHPSWSLEMCWSSSATASACERRAQPLLWASPGIWEDEAGWSWISSSFRLAPGGDTLLKKRIGSLQTTCNPISWGNSALSWHLWGPAPTWCNSHGHMHEHMWKQFKSNKI